MTDAIKTENNLIDLVLDYIQASDFDRLPKQAIDDAKKFIYDSFGVGISGSRVANVNKIKQALIASGDLVLEQPPARGAATIWVTGEKTSSSVAALINGYQIHNQEWDCVHEKAVVHPMATILATLAAFAESQSIPPKQLILGVVVAVDIATLIGASVNNPLQFFRPSVCGCIGATAGMAAMLDITKEQTANALGIAYSQISGTMQAHVEGSPMLAMQIGINARSAITAINLAIAGFEGPKDILQGPFGYFNLFEKDYDDSVIPEKLGKEYQISRISHKPFPTGRAGHGTVDGIQTLMKKHGFDKDDIHAINVAATPLINRLVGRPVKDDMDPSYAKLCNGYIAATALLTGTVTVQDFDNEKLRDQARLSLAELVTTSLNECDDPNALAPMSVTVTLHNGKSYTEHFPAVLGHPDRPLSKAQQDQKFTLACQSARGGMSNEQIHQLQSALYQLDEITSINQIIELTLV